MGRTAIWMFELQALFVPRSVRLNRHPFRSRSECLESGLRPQHLEGGSKVRIGPSMDAAKVVLAESIHRCTGNLLFYTLVDE